jgi:hypothetical protein
MGAKQDVSDVGTLASTAPVNLKSKSRSDVGTLTSTAPANLKSESRSDVGTSTAPVNFTSGVGTLTSNASPRQSNISISYNGIFFRDHRDHRWDASETRHGSSIHEVVSCPHCVQASG